MTHENPDRGDSAHHWTRMVESTVDLLPPASDEAALFAHWDRIRARSPVVWSAAQGVWLVVSHDAAVATLSSDELSTDPYAQVRPSPLALPSSFELDDDSNQRVHRAVTACIGPRTMPMDVIDDGCADVIASAPVDRPVDFSRAVAEPVARALTRRWFGFAERELASYLALFAAAQHDRDPARRDAAARLVTNRMLDTIAERRRRPRGDLLSRLAAAWTAAGAEDWWLVAFLAPMFTSLVGGFAARLLTHTALNLARYADTQDDVCTGGWVRARQAALEAARLDPVNPGVPRRARTEVTLGGTRVPAGGLVWVVLPAVCRDPAAYPDPHSFRLDRKSRNLAFGIGRHSCTGRELALAVAASAVTELLVRKGARLSAVPDDPPTFRYGLGRSCVRLPLVLERRPGRARARQTNSREGGEKLWRST